MALAATLAVGGWLFVLDERMTDTGGPGIIGFELAATEDRAAEMLGDWGEEGRDAAKLSLWFDYAYLASYGLLFWLLVAAARDRASGWTPGPAARFGPWIGWAPIAAAGFDAIENVFLLLTLGRHGGAVAPALGAGLATLKFASLALTAAFLLTFGVEWFQNRRVGADR